MYNGYGQPGPFCFDSRCQNSFIQVREGGREGGRERGREEREGGRKEREGGEGGREGQGWRGRNVFIMTC
jgi:hypothetical protein